MELDSYRIKAGKRSMSFEFISEGPKGKIVKLIRYQSTDFRNIYNLSFGDKNHASHIDDNIVTNNGDAVKVLATVANTLQLFLDHYPDAWVYAAGSTRSRTRLYRMGIAMNLHEIIEFFELYGLIGENWELFRKDKEYDAFLVRKKRTFKS